MRTARLSTVSLLLGLIAYPVAAQWNPASFAGEDTLEFFTVNDAGEEHWATVWFVLDSGDVYLRLGARAEGRIRGNIHRPTVKVRVGGRVYDNVLAEEAPDKIATVAELMGEKYWTAMFMKYMPDRYTVRLTAAE